MILNGNNLGERHRDLNLKVTEAAAKLTNFEQLKSQPERNDVDKLYRIDLASKYKNVDYVLEVLRCGDVFLITRALKCLWLYADEYSQYINTVYLDTNIFPYMSTKMKRKMLTTISIHVRKADRAIDFYKYCADSRLNDHAFKFLLFTPDGFKLNILKARNFSNFNNSKFLKHFIGSSFELALTYLAVCKYSYSVIHKLRYLYSVSDEDYLNILEKHVTNETRFPHCSQRLGLRISKDILNKYKERVLNNPLLYVNILNKQMLIKHLAVTDIETLALDLLPESSEGFWCLDFYNAYKFMFAKFPANKLFVYLKQIYQSKYKEDAFELTIQFYQLKYYEMFNIDEREAWALQHIERDEELPDIDNYIWYSFVSFSKAFSGIKRYIFLTPDKNERSRIVNILPETARNQTDIHEILCYYYGRHVNESEEHRESFIDKMIEVHDIYSFNEECWTAFDKLLYSLDVYTTGSYTRPVYKIKSLFYHILHNKDLPEGLKDHIECLCNFYHIESLVEQLSEERKAVCAKYLMNYFAKKIELLMGQPGYSCVKKDENCWTNDSIKDEIQELVCKIWSIIYSFKRPDEDCPDIVIRFMESHMHIYQYHDKYKTKFVKQSEDDFVRWLKQDVQMAVDGIYEIRCNTYRWNFRLCRLFRKLKVYFPHDVGKEYLDYFMEYLSDIPKGYREYRNIKMAVVGVFYLADQEAIINFFEKNVPVTSKIDHMNIDNQVLQVQKAICRLAYHPRPPVPFSYIQKYITGDYTHYSLPIFSNYFANLPSNEKFIESLLDAPLSIQKHGLRFACKGYDAEILKPIIEGAWKKTKNVSLRMLLYKELFDRMLNESENFQNQLYDVLKLYTSELNHDDHEYVYSLLVSDGLPDMFKGDFIETAWLTVSELSDKSVDIRRRTSVITHMEKYIHLVQRDFSFQIVDDHIYNMLCEKNINRDCDEDHSKELINAKWNLTAKYIVSFSNEEEKEQSIELMQTIVAECLESWNIVKHQTYTLRKFMKKFIKTIMNKDPKTVMSCAKMVFIYECIHDKLNCVLKKEEIYLMNWELELSIISRHIIHNERKMGDTESKNILIKKMAHAYGKEVGRMLVSGIRKKEFYRCYYQPIANIVNDIGNTICTILHIDRNGFVYYVCDSLIKIKMTETHLLALFMLPTDPVSNWKSEHSKTLIKIKKQCVSREVRSFLFEKYVLRDCAVRQYVTHVPDVADVPGVVTARKKWFVCVVLGLIFVFSCLYSWWLQFKCDCN